MKKEVFERIMSAIGVQQGATCRESLELLRRSFPAESVLTLRSIFSQELCRRMKLNHWRHKARGASYFQRYMARRRGPGILVTLAAEIGIPAALLARIVLEHMQRLQQPQEEEATGSGVVTSPGGTTSRQISRLLRDTSLIEDPVLAQDVQLCVLEDEQYGPLADVVNHSLGQQYEHLLRLQLTQRGVPFLDEAQMRSRGMDKTPDIKLEVPVAVDGFIIHWIESKALFGSEEWHSKYIKNQLSTYWNRYGPGMVIYWFDFVDTLQPMHQKHLLVANCLSDNLVMMDPTKRL